MDNISLKTFFETVEQRLAACSTDELRDILRRMAQQTPPSERQAFLDGLQPPADTVALAETVAADELLAEIDDLALEYEEARENADPYEEDNDWYDHDDEDSLGPYEELIQPLARLFDQTQAAFDYGNFSLAREAYAALFELCDQEDDYGRGISITDIEGLEKTEAYARYLRAVYETEPAERRPEALYGEMRQVRSWIRGARPVMVDLIEISPRPLPDGERFWPAWIAFLDEQEPKGVADAWLREAVWLSQGVAGLEQLAQAQGTRRPRVYLDWLAVLEQEGRYADELSVAQEALQTLAPDLPIRAAVADRLCRAAAELKDNDALRAGRWEAFGVAPVLERLLDLWEAFSAAPWEERTANMQRAVEHIRAYLARPRSEAVGGFPTDEDDYLERRVWIDNTVLVHAHLLSGDWRSAYQLVAKDAVLGWSSSSGNQGWVMAVFLVLLAGKQPAALKGNLAQFWALRLNASGGYVYTSKSELIGRIGGAYAELLPHLVLERREKEEILAWCLDVANRRVDAIVGGQHRSSYDKAAQLAAACTEMLRWRADRAQANAFWTDARERFPRHRAFQAEMKTAEQWMEPAA